MIHISFQLLPVLDRMDILSNKNGCSLQFASRALAGDRAVALTAVKQNGYALEYASGVLQDDREVVITSSSAR